VVDMASVNCVLKTILKIAARTSVARLGARGRLHCSGDGCALGVTGSVGPHAHLVASPLLFSWLGDSAADWH